jgi:outer membrane protein assembly factor BamB
MQLLILLSFLSFFVHETKTISSTGDGLLKKTREYMEHYEARSQSNGDEICTLYATYSQVDPAKALNILSKLLDWHLKYSLANNNFLKFLALCDAQMLQKYVSKIMDNAYFLPIFTETLWQNLDMQSQFQNTALDYDKIISSLFTRDLTQEANGKALSKFFTHGSHFHEKYKDNIIAILPEFLHHHEYEYDSLVSLLSPSCPADVQKKAMETLVVYSSDPQCPNSLAKYITNDLFKKDVMKDKKSELYACMEKVYQETENIVQLQRFWKHLRYDRQYKELVYSSMAKYYNVPREKIPATYFDRLNALNQVLEIALKNNTVPSEKIHKSLLAAHETKLENYISSKLLEQQQKSVICNETAPVQLRVDFLNNYFMFFKNKFFQSQKITKFHNDIENTLPPTSEFRAYADNVYKTLKIVKLSSFKKYKAKKAIKEFHKNHNLEYSFPEIVKPLANFSRHHYSSEKPTDHISFDQKFVDPRITEDGFVYGTVQKIGNKSCLYACEINSGDAVWKLPLNDNYVGRTHGFFETPFTYQVSKNILPYAIAGENFYVVSGTEIMVLDKATGLEKSRFSAGNKKPINFLAATQSGIFYTVDQEHNIVALDQATDYSVTYTIPAELHEGGISYFMVGDKLARYYAPQDTITVYDKNMNSNVLQTDLLEERWGHIPHINTKNERLYFVKQLKDKTKNLVCVDTESMEEKWTYPLEKNLQFPPCISPDGKRAYLLTKSKIIGLETDDRLNHNQRKIWETDLERRHLLSIDIDQLAVSPDGKKLYGLHGEPGSLRIFNTENGKMELSKDIKEARTHKLIGFSPDGKLVIQPMSY